jgi:hypothetical protein
MVRPVSQSEQIPVSPKMIEAGLRAMEAWKNLPPGEVIAAVYRAMVAAAPVDRTHTEKPSPTIIEILKRFERK